MLGLEAWFLGSYVRPKFCNGGTACGTSEPGQCRPRRRAHSFSGTQEEAEVLIALDAVVEKADREWRSYLIGTVRDFVVGGLTPVGQVDRAKAEWLVVVLSSGVARKTARTLARAIAREAYQVDEALLIFGAGRRKWQESNRWMGQKRPMPQRARDATLTVGSGRAFRLR